MTDLNRQQICAALGVSESTIRRLEHAGLPYTPVGKRSKRYDLEECKAWLRNSYQPDVLVQKPSTKTSGDLQRAAKEFAESCLKVKLRVYPSS